MEKSNDCHVKFRLRSTHIKLVEFSHHASMLFSVFEKVCTRLRKQDLTYGINDPIVVRMEVNRKLAAVKLASFAITFVQNILVLTSASCRRTRLQQLIEQ